ncbi:hypothetical protein EDC96DRAFT_447196 [Choanephora cucurbitarum]|nr:hypothetical protein EDC96DRAFT_447196 [Choanephora cucurbitarum]
MKETIFDYNQTEHRENITYHFQPSRLEGAIKQAIIQRCRQKRPSIPLEQLHQHHIGGLPSPPVEERKACLSEDICIKEEPVYSAPPTLSAQEIREKIEALKQEKHRLFQLIKVMLHEEQEKQKQQKLTVEQQNKKRSTKKKSRWAPVSTIPPSPLLSPPPYSSNDAPFHYARSPAPSSRYDHYVSSFIVYAK